MAEPKVSMEGDIPWGQLAAPARRALAEAGYTRLEDLTQLTDRQVRQLHGIGPKALSILRSAMKAQGLSFASEGG